MTTQSYKKTLDSDVVMKLRVNSEDINTTSVFSGNFEYMQHLRICIDVKYLRGIW